MFLDINTTILKNKSIFEYIASSIEKNFPNTQEDVEKIKKSVVIEDIKSIFNEYYDGWKYDNVNFQFEDIDNILYWIDKENELQKNGLEYKKWVMWLSERGLSPNKNSKTNKKSS